jgi:class 3 adenylate cyclase
VISSGEEQLESHRREIAVVSGELRGFAGLTETADPESVLTVLREFHAAVGELLFRSDGTLGHFTGGGLMVFFNDPVPCDEPSRRAVELALDLHASVRTLQQSWRWLSHDLGFAAGIATGYATLGRVGFEGRYDYDAIGPVTILADHLCSQSQAGQTLVSQRVYGSVQDLVEVERVGELLPREFLRPVTAFNVRGLKESPSFASSSLSPREREVAALVARGLTNRQIAEQLVVTEATAAKHVENILGKLGFATRSQVAVWAVQQRHDLGSSSG